jgi:hypothetical protein
MKEFHRLLKLQELMHLLGPTRPYRNRKLDFISILLLHQSRRWKGEILRLNHGKEKYRQAVVDCNCISVYSYQREKARDRSGHL